MNIPLNVLIQANEALKLAQGLRMGQGMDAQQWVQVLGAYNRLDVYLGDIVRALEVEVTND